VKRIRQLSRLWNNEDLENYYPCPKCDHGYLKLRHHICPCDQEKINCKAVVKVAYGTAPTKEEAAAKPADAAKTE
jgi:hypothetical protein